MVSENELIGKLKLVCPDIDEKKLSGQVLFKDLGLDSMDIASFMLEIEESYGIKIPNAELGKLHNIYQVADHINRRSA